MALLHKRTGKILAEKIDWMQNSKARSIGLLKYSVSPKSFAAIFSLPFGGFFPLIHTFGMKFEIDVLFCSRDRKVIYKKLNLKPQRLCMPPGYFFGGAPFLIECAQCNLSEIEIGDELSWEIPLHA